MKELVDLIKELAALLLPSPQRHQFLEELKQAISPEQFRLVQAVFEGSAEILETLNNRDLTTKKLVERLFGPKTEKGSHLCGGPPKKKEPKKGKRPGHGRIAHKEYTGARRIRIEHPELKPGQGCPECRQGKLRQQKEPARSVKLTAQAPVSATIHERRWNRTLGWAKR